MSRLDGIDTSHFQTITDPKAFPALKFAITKFTQGAGFVDPKAGEHLAAYRADPEIIVTGGYHYLNASRPGVEQANHFIDVATKLGLRPGEMVVVDWERDEHQEFPPSDIVQACLRTLDARYGAHRVFMYCARWVTGFAQWRATDPNRPLIYANYGDNGHIAAAQWGAAVLQYTDRAVVPGFASPIDGNEVLNPAAFLALGNKVPPVTAPPRKPVFARWNPPKSFGAWPWKAKPIIRPAASDSAVAYATTVIAFKAGGHIVRSKVYGLDQVKRIKDLQALFGIRVDGIIGPQTWGAIDMLAKAAK